jgi:hypothetical protein
MFFIVSGSHTSTLEQPVFAQAGQLLSTGGVPEVPPVRNFVEDSHFEGGSQMLDGLSCKGCTFKDTTLAYGGGAFTLVDCNFSGNTRVVLSGAAVNTLSILPLLQALAKGTPPTAPPPKKPIEKNAIAPQLVKVNFASPFGQ